MLSSVYLDSESDSLFFFFFFFFLKKRFLNLGYLRADTLEHGPMMSLLYMQ